MPGPAHVVVRSVLERQLALLTPVAHRLEAVSRGASRAADHLWRGPTATDFRAAEEELAEQMRAAAGEASDLVRRVRLALAVLS